MDSWTLQGDSYSFLRSAPRNFSLCHRDGTPNHVEIFDIINVPAQQSAISETTCLCDIFGDDRESPSVSSSPPAGAFVPSQREGTAAASPQVDDLNDSSGSYHTAQGSSEGEEGSEDLGETFYSPVLQKKFSEDKQLEEKGLSSDHPEVSEENISRLEPKSVTPVPQLCTSTPASVTPSSQGLNSGERTPSPECYSPSPFNPEGRLSSLSSSSADNRLSSTSPGLKESYSEVEPRRITPSLKEKQSSPSNQSLASTSSLPQDLFEPRAGHFSDNNSPSPELGHLSQDRTDSDLESRVSLSPPLTSPSGSESKSHSRGAPVSFELRNSFPLPDTQAQSPFPELRGRISLPDLFSRGSTPDIEDPASTPELISDPSAVEKNIITTPESQETRLSADPGSSFSTPGPRYTPPSPVLSVPASPRFVGDTVSPEFRNTSTSPGLLSPASPANTRSRSPSPDPSANRKNSLTFSETRTQVSSTVVSLSPSPAAQHSSSPTERRYTTPSPEIRITASSPEVKRKEKPPQGKSESDSPLLDPHFGSASPRSPTSSPHITGICYSVVQPEDRNSPPFPELQRQRTPLSSEASKGSTDSDVARSPGSLRRSTPSSVSLSEATILPQPRTQTPSPQPNPLTPSPEPGYQTPTSVKVQSPSPPHRSRDQSPQFSEQKYQQSPATLSTDYPLYTNPTSVRLTPEIKIDPVTEDIKETQSPAHLEKDSPSLAFELDKREIEAVAELPSSSPVEVVCSPLSVSSDKSLDKSLIQQTTEREGTIKEAYIQDRSSGVSSTEENQDVHSPFFQNEEIKSLSPNLIAQKDRNPNISPVHRATSNPPVRQDNLNSPIISPLNIDTSVFSPKWAHTPENSRRQLVTRVRCVNRERFTQDMSHHGNRRQTPSPPLTRFTPVHIIAPEKPYRQWQNRSRSPSQVFASSSSGNLKKGAPNRESPSADPVDTYSQAHWVRMGRQLEMEKEMPSKQERDAVLKKKTDRGMDRETEREERAPERGEGWQGVASYRGEQVELSFSARNRKGPVSRSAAPTSRETSQPLPTVHSYSESLLETRQPQQQQSLLKLPSQQDTRGSSASRKLQPPASQNRKSAPRRLATNRPCQSSSSSMGSELDEADNEVKWLTDVAFRSLSSPEVDYLDMYNSSHCSSTNISQPSTQESPAGVNAAWLAYADFRGSAPKLDHDDHSFQQPSAHCSDSLDPCRRYELGSFECIDVALEREDCRKVRRGVPKRQIQLKRRSNAEGKQEESSENSSPGVPAMVESPSEESHPRATFMRQHSTPAAMQECYPSEVNSELSQQKERQSKLQKSASVDETCSKTKMASCIIKNVLSKKMQSADGQPNEQASKEISPPAESMAGPLKESPKPDSRDLSSSLHSDYSLSSEGFPVREEPNTKQQAKLSKSHGTRTGTRPSSSSSGRSVTFPQTDSEEAVSHSRSSKSSASEMKSELKVAFESKKSQTGLHQRDEREADDSANATAWDTGASSASTASNTQERVTNKDQACENTEPNKQPLQADKGASKTQKITLRAVEKKKASLNVCLTPEAESKPGPFSADGSIRDNEEKTETSANEKTESEGHENNQAKAPIHKVRDVRPLVKNTYNLSFKAGSSVSPSNANEEKMHGFNNERREEASAAVERDLTQEIKREEKKEAWMERKEEQIENVKDSEVLMLHPSAQNTGSSPSGQQPMQIEYKAVCWKDEKNKTSSIKNNLGDKTQESIHSLGKESPSLNANASSQTTGDKVVQELSEHEINIEAETQKTTKEIHRESNSEVKPVMTRTDRKPPMLGSLPKLPSKEREVSTAVVLIREKPNKTNKSASSAQEETPASMTPASIQAPAPASLSPGPVSPSSPSGSGGHSVSMLLKERGYQADIGAVVGDNQSTAGAKGVPRKHVNCLEIPLQTMPPSHGGLVESHRERTFSSSSTTSGPSAVTDNTGVLAKPREDEGVCFKSEGKDTTKQKINPQEQLPCLTKQKDLGDFEAVKRIDPTFPPRSPAIKKFKPQAVEVNSSSKETQKQEMPTNSMGNQRPQTIEVKSIAKSSQKPAVPPKPNCKFKPADSGATPLEAQRTSATLSSPGRPQSEERPQTIVVSSPTIYRKISNESTSASNYSRKLTVSAVSSLKLPPHKTTATDSSNQTNQSTAPSDTEATSVKVQHQQSAASPQSSRNAQNPASLSTTPATGISVIPAPSLVSDPQPNQITGAIPPGTSQSALVDQGSQSQFPRAACLHDPALPGALNNTKQLTGVPSTKVQRFPHQPCSRSLSSERAQRLDNLRFYASDDPPSYDERESFSPLLLPDLAPLRSNRCQPSYRPPPCSCTAGCPSHSGHTSPHHHCSPHNFTPPVPPSSSGQALPYQVSLPPLHPHQCRPDPQPMNYQPGSPKSSPLGPSQPPSMYQPLHQSAPCPPHPPLMQAFSSDRSLPPQHAGPRRPPVHRSPHQQPPNMAGGPYNDPGHNHSPVLPSMDHQYLCGPQTMGSSYGSDYGGDSSSLYSESGYGQPPRRVLLDPETGKYFYIEVPVQPLRKMLFDPETGQYVEVLIPQQAMSHSGLYPPSAAPFPPLHNPNMYAPAPQCMPCAAPPPLAHPQAQPQPPQYPEASAAAAMHPSRPGVSYRNPSGQGYKPEPQNHPPLDHSYLENMYYVPTGMNASPNPTPPDYFHKHPPNMPPTGGKRS